MFPFVPTDDDYGDGDVNDAMDEDDDDDGMTMMRPS